MLKWHDASSPEQIVIQPRRLCGPPTEDCAQCWRRLQRPSRRSAAAICSASMVPLELWYSGFCSVMLVGLLKVAGALATGDGRGSLVR